MNKAETAYRTIAEVSDLLQVQPSVLRFWETQFHQVKPMKRMGRRYYSAEDVVLLARIRDDLYQSGFTIKGVQKRLREHTIATTGPGVPSETPKASDSLLRDLVEIRDSLVDYI